MSYLITFKTTNNSGTIDPLREENLNSSGFHYSDISSISVSFQHPGILYTEQGVASPNHPCAGSTSAHVLLNDGRKITIDEIFYYDINVNKKHADGLPHWNHETRIREGNNIVSWKKESVPYHVIPDSPQIEISLIENGVEMFKNVIKNDKNGN
jgi:hypothetical protein